MQALDVEVFIADTRDHDCEVLVAELGVDCKHRLSGISHPGRRAQFILGRILIRHALSCGYEPVADAWRLDAASGKPCLVGVGVPHISLSHSRHLVACALASRPIGLDVEYCRDRDFVALAPHFCDSAELRRFLSIPVPERNAAFYRSWTRMEAIFKLNGGGQAEGEPCLSYFHPEAGFLGALAAYTCHPVRLVVHPPFRG